MTVETQLEAGRTWSRRNGIDSRVSSARAGMVTRRSAASPCSSDGCTSWRNWLKNGRLASTIGPVETTPGTSVRASWRRGGKAAFRALKVGMATASVWGRLRTAAVRATFERANACAVVLKSVTRFWSVCGLALSAAATVPAWAMKFDRSWGWMPSASWLTMAEYLYAGSQYWIEAL